MRLAISRIPADQPTVEIVERKGIGHPDSLADILADEFSRQYSLYAMDHFGGVPNHWVDKVAIVGAASHVEFGKFSIEKPITSHLFGKVTTSIGISEIPIEDLFRIATSKVLLSATHHSEIVQYVRHNVENTSGTAADHPHHFYFPANADECRGQATQRWANDTTFCTARAPATSVERLAIDLENRINGSDFTSSFPQIGSDVKVMILHVDSSLDITVCLPFHPELTSSLKDYRSTLSAAREYLEEFVSGRAEGMPASRIRIAINTKDANGGAYLAPFGTSLGKGDCGLVGRGNKFNGVISSFQATGTEAFSGKNPLHHAGKLYTLAATRIARRLYREFLLPNETTLMSRNGDPLDRPAFVSVRLHGRVTPSLRSRTADIVADTLSGLDLLTEHMLKTSAIDQFRDPCASLRVD